MTGTAEAVDRFNEAFNRHDVDAVMAAMTDDCVFENTSPPNGQRYEGQAQVRAAWEEFFAASPDARFDGEDVIVAGDRCVVQWVYRWTNDDGSTRLAARRRRAARARRQGRREVRLRQGLVNPSDGGRVGSARRCGRTRPRCARCRRRRPSRDGSSRARRAPSRAPAPPSRSAPPRPRPPARRLRSPRGAARSSPCRSSAPSCTVQHSRCARWPITTSSPTTVGVIGVVCRTAPSCTEVRAPTRITRSRPAARPGARRSFRHRASRRRSRWRPGGRRRRHRSSARCRRGRKSPSD